MICFSWNISLIRNDKREDSTVSVNHRHELSLFNISFLFHMPNVTSGEHSGDVGGGRSKKQRMKFLEIVHRPNNMLGKKTDTSLLMSQRWQ